MNKLLSVGLLWALIGCGASEPARESTEPSASNEETPTPAPETLPGAETDPRRACTATAECVLVEAACGGSIGVNAAHAAAFGEEQINMRPLISCLVGPPVPPPMHPECVNAVCTAVLDELPGAES